MEDKRWPHWVCEYVHDGKRFGIDVCAPTFEDAQERLRSIGWTGIVNGKWMMTIPVTPGAAPVFVLWARLYCWWKNNRKASAIERVGLDKTQGE